MEQGAEETDPQSKEVKFASEAEANTHETQTLMPQNGIQQEGGVNVWWGAKGHLSYALLLRGSKRCAKLLLMLAILYIL